jgi:hypothetical protein
MGSSFINFEIEFHRFISEFAAILIVADSNPILSNGIEKINNIFRFPEKY